MDELSHVLGAVARLVVVLGGGLSTVMVAYAGVKWMTAAGDPQEMAKARMALLGALGGLVLVGVGFVGPRVVNEAVVRPVGGVTLDLEVGFNCDQVLRDQLVFQRGASPAERMNRVIRVIQSQRRDCSQEVWDPQVHNAGYTVVLGSGSAGGAGPCFDLPAGWGCCEGRRPCGTPESPACQRYRGGAS